MERGDMSIKTRRGEGRVNRFSKLAEWCKRVLTGQRGEAGEGKKSTRGMPPQGKIKTPASRTRATVIPEPEDSAVSGLGAAQRREDQHLEATEDDEPMDSEEGAITSEASKIFLAYLEGDQEAAKIVHGWAQKERDRS